MQYRMLLVSASLALIWCGCSQLAGLTGVTPTAAQATGATRPAGKIQHVVIIIQENRSFDNLFAGFPGADAPLTGLRHNGKRVSLHEATLQQRPNVDIKHDYRHSQIEYDAGKMDGFDEDVWMNGQPAKTYPYAYLSRKQVAVLGDGQSVHAARPHVPYRLGTQLYRPPRSHRRHHGRKSFSESYRKRNRLSI